MNMKHIYIYTYMQMFIFKYDMTSNPHNKKVVNGRTAPLLFSTKCNPMLMDIHN